MRFVKCGTSGFTRMIVPLENAKEAAVVQEIEVFGVGSLAQAVGFLSGQLLLDTTVTDIDDLFGVASHYDVDFADVKGQESVKLALTIAAAGAHNIMLLYRLNFASGRRVDPAHPRLFC